MRFFEKLGHDIYFRLFPNELHIHSNWRQTQTIAFSACLLGTMVFSQDEGKVIDSDDCINSKHKIPDLIYQEVLSLRTAALNVNTNPFLNHKGVNINMIESNDEWCVNKVITMIVHD